MDNNGVQEYCIKDILDSLTIVSMNSTARDEIISSLVVYLKKSARHNYHEITRYIIQKYSSIADGETVSVILDNIDIIIDHIKDSWECNEECAAPRDCRNLDKASMDCPNFHETTAIELPCSDCKNLYRFVIKLKDHIFLEFFRLTEIRSENEKIEEKMRDVTRAEEDLMNMQEDLCIRIEDARKESHAALLQTVSVLGIFAAIVVAIFGGAEVIASITDGFAAVSVNERTSALFTSSLITMFVIDLIYVLLSFITYLNDKAFNIRTTVIVAILNIACIVAVCYCV